VQQLMGLVAHYTSFILNASEITAPIRQLLRAAVKFHWSDQCETAWKKIKNILTSNQTLVPLDPELPLIVATDASQEGVGAVLSHNIDGIEKLTAYALRSLSDWEKRYSQID